MSYEVLIDHISFARDEARGEDGAIWYLVLGEPNENVVCSVHLKRTHHYERQAFAKDGPKKRPGATAQEIAEDKANIWGWNGDAAAPTIEPSFLARTERPYCMHSYVRGGKLELCGDSTVTLSTERSCMFEAATPRPLPEEG